MKLTKPENENYAAVVISVGNITPLEGCDNVVGTTMVGFQSIVSKDTGIGTMGIMFPAESQLSEEYAKYNNLFRDTSQNRDKGAKGYLEANRRIRAVKFRGHRSDCLFMPLESLGYIKGLKIDQLKEGDTFDRIGDHEICKKYKIKRKAGTPRIEKNKDKWVRTDKKFLPEHYKTDQYFRFSDTIPPERDVIVTQKLHGTSVRIGNTYVARKLSLLDKVAKRLGVSVKEQELDYVYGSRRVIKDANNTNQDHFYDSDIHTTGGKKLDGLIPEGYVVYAELIGWTAEGGPIQKSYTYQVPHGTSDLYVYRVANINPQGFICDLSWDQVLEFCRDRNIKTVPTLWAGKHKDFKVEEWLDIRYSREHPQAVPLDEESPCDEGVCVRVDGIAPYILKAKSPVFYEHETKMNDEQVVDIEEEQA